MHSDATAVRRCAACGENKPAIAFRPTRRRCKRCEHKAPRARGGGISFTCPVCGRTIVLSPGKAARAVYCSRTCFGAARRAKGERERWMRPCRTCGRLFYAPPSVRDNPTKAGFYCSIACRPVRVGWSMSAEQKAAMSAARTGRTYGRGPAMAAFVCAHCGSAFAAPRKQARRRFCGTSCWHAYIRLHPEVHAHWRGGVEPYYGPNWDEQARRARARDGHRCRDCGKRQTRPLLDVHHLMPRRAFNGDHLRANRLENLVSLCKACHARRECLETQKFA